jgi:hypothetical protein
MTFESSFLLFGREGEIRIRCEARKIIGIKRDCCSVRLVKLDCGVLKRGKRGVWTDLNDMWPR